MTVSIGDPVTAWAAAVGDVAKAVAAIANFATVVAQDQTKEQVQAITDDLRQDLAPYHAAVRFFNRKLGIVETPAAAAPVAPPA